MSYEVCESRTAPGEWRVESVGSEGEVYVATFSGPGAEERARAYVAAADTIKELRSGDGANWEELDALIYAANSLGTARARKLSLADASEIEAEMRRLESDPGVSARQLRLFMQSPMPCGHAVGNLLTCPDPPFGCVICGEPESP